MVLTIMQNEIAAWRLAPSNGSSLERLSFYPAPDTLDLATQQLPGGGYTTLRTFGRFRILRLEDHFTRLEETAQLAGRPVRLDRQRLVQALRQALSAFPNEDMRVRVILDLDQQPGTVYILIDALQTPQAEDYRRGVKAVTRRLQRENPKAKLTGFIDTAATIREELPEGINEAIMVGDKGCLLEGLSSNFFAVKTGVICTAEEGVLSGITRSLALEVIRAEGIPVRLEGVKLAELEDMDEAFITSASRAVLPVTEIDGKPVGDGLPGPVTRRLIVGYQERLAKDLDTIE